MKRISNWLLVLPILFATGCNRVRPVAEIAASEDLPVRSVSISVSANDWPWWGGPSRNGVSAAVRVPVTWTEKNVLWSVDVPGRGHSSPCVWQDRVYLTTADDAAERQSLLGFDRATGQLVWNATIHEGGFMRSHQKNSHASATPACDGQHVYTAFINGGFLNVTAVGLDGNIVWQQPAGPFGSEHGYGSSPVLYGALVIVVADNLTGSFVAALDRQTGKIVWRTARPTTGRHGSFATPAVAQVAGRPQLIVTGMGQVTSYHPATGKAIWWCDGPTDVTACTAAASDELVFASGGFPDKEILAIRADGQGDVTRSHIVWRARRGVTYVPSPLYHEGRLFVVNDEGIATCFNADTGDVLGQKRLADDFSASPIYADGRLYATNEKGKTFVLKADPSFEILAENYLADGGFASPAICGNQIFVRSLHQLFCLVDQEAGREAAAAAAEPAVTTVSANR